MKGDKPKEVANMLDVVSIHEMFAEFRLKGPASRSLKFSGRGRLTVCVCVCVCTHAQGRRGSIRDATEGWREAA